MSGGKLPEGWGKTEIGDIADVISGGTPKSGIAENFAPSGEGIAWLTPADLSGYKKKFISHGARDLSTEGYSSCSAKLMPAGAILFSSRAPIGYVAVASNKIATNQGFKSFVFTNDIYPDYAYYYLRNIRHLAEEMGTGTTFKEISGSAAKTLPFVMAPLAEQTIIAEKLDTLLAQVDSTKARLEQIPQILKRFRQAVLTTAVYGSLTKEWRENKKIHAPTPTTLEALINSIDQGWSPKCENYPADKHEWGVIKTTAVQPGYFISDGNKKLPSSLAPKFNLSLKKDDILITRAGPRSRCGITCIVNQDYPYLMICDKVYRVRVNHQKILSGFLNWCLNSPKYLEIIERIKTGSSDSGMNLTQKKFLSFTINVPDILEQHEIVRRVEQLFAYADTIEKQVNSALTRVNSLTQSILAKAFRGELTAQWRAENPDLISGENSAAALLEKIKAERAASGGKKTSRKKA
ncbi:restriction endonuclease subunit S [Citrobacter portucalensis]|uniref:restriction endonuclease subunit S n=1 Tax=Citrobacter portucalensis TaxID=1639133 RepID=UPI0015E9DC5A|nr:restriction endonuclease subunit S [Citrobacter freundii]